MSTPDTSAGSAAAEALADAAIDYGDAPSPGGWPRFRRRLKRAVAPFAVVLAVLVVLCLWFRIYSPDDLFNFYGFWRSNDPPVWRAIVMRQVGVGDSAAAFVKDYPPFRQVTSGRFTFYEYLPVGAYSRFVVAAEDGKLILAEYGTLFYSKIYFEHHRAELSAAYDRYRLAQIDRRQTLWWFAKHTTTVGDAITTFAAMGAGGSAEPEPNDPESAATQAQDAGAAQSAIRLVPLSEERLALLKDATMADDGRIIRSTAEAEIVLAPDGTEVARIQLNGRRVVYHQGLPVALSGAGSLTLLDAAFRETTTFATVDRAFCRTFDGRTFVKFGPAELLPGYQAPDYGFAVYDATGKLLLERGAESGLEFVGETSSAVLVRQADPERKSDDAFQLLGFDGRERLATTMPTQEVDANAGALVSDDGRYFAIYCRRYQHPKSISRIFRDDGQHVLDHAGTAFPYFFGDLLVLVDVVDRDAGRVGLQPVRLSETAEPNKLPAINVEFGARANSWELALCHGGDWLLMWEHSIEDDADHSPRRFVRNVMYNLATGSTIWATPRTPYAGSNTRHFGRPSPWTPNAILTYGENGELSELIHPAP